MEWQPGNIGMSKDIYDHMSVKLLDWVDVLSSVANEPKYGVQLEKFRCTGIEV